MRKIAVLTAAIFIALFAASQGQLAPENQQQSSKNSGKKSADDTGNAEPYSDQVLERLLRELKAGLEGHDQRKTLSVFAGDQLDGYLQLQDQLTQFFATYDSFRIRYRIVQSSAEQEKGIAVVEIQMEADPRDPGGAALRRDEQIRFELARGKRGWQVVDFGPRNLFTP